MQDKMKFILIGLAAALILMLFFLLQSFQSAGKLKTERDTLNDTNNALNIQLAGLKKENNQIKEDFISTKRSLDKLDADKAAAEKTLQSVSEEKEKLAADLQQLRDKLKALQQVPPSTESTPRNNVEETPVSPSADAYWAGILRKKAELELKLDSVRSDLKAAKMENEQLRREKEKMEMDVKSFESDQKDSNRESQYNKKLADNLTVELTREKTDKFQLVETLKALKSENKSLKQQLKVIFDRKTRLEEKFSALQDKNAVLESNMAKMESFVREKILQVDNLKNDLGIVSPAPSKGSSAAWDELSSRKKNSIDLAPIVVRPQETAPARAPAQVYQKTAAVIAINKDNNFVIINIGSSSGVRVGDSFQVFRKEEPVALVEAIQVRDNISACDIKSENIPIAVGDTAIR